MSHFCPTCGTPLPPDAHFCQECGHRMDDVPASEQPTQILGVPPQPPGPVPTPMPATGPPPDSGNRNLLILIFALVAVVAAMAIMAFIIWRGGSNTSGSGDGTLASPSASPSPTPTVTKTKTAKPTPTVTVTRTTIPDLPDGDGGDIPSDYKACGGGVYANGVTSCPFANNVASAWYASGGNTYLPSVYSPTTGKYYDMYCTDALPARCTGGNDAAVVIDYLP